MNRMNILLSTTASDAADTARRYGLGIEIAQFCTAWNLDDEFETADTQVLAAVEGIARRVLHAPFNELFPCAIDRKARALAAARYRQAIALAKRYGAEKVVIHAGFNPWIYYPEWFIAQSVVFWQEFLREDPGVQLVLENVLETEPDWLVEIVRGVNHPKLRLCLDIGHANAYTRVPVQEWLERCGSWISHFHIHNNDGTWDTHRPLFDGTIPMREFLSRAGALCPEATVTLELMEAEPSVKWLLEE